MAIPGPCLTLVLITRPDPDPHPCINSLSQLWPIPIPKDVSNAQGWGCPCDPHLPVPGWGWDRPWLPGSAIIHHGEPPMVPDPKGSPGPAGCWHHHALSFCEALQIAKGTNDKANHFHLFLRVAVKSLPESLTHFNSLQSKEMENYRFRNKIDCSFYYTSKEKWAKQNRRGEVWS